MPNRTVWVWSTCEPGGLAWACDEGYRESRMRETCTSGSLRGDWASGLQRVLSPLLYW